MVERSLTEVRPMIKQSDIATEVSQVALVDFKVAGLLAGSPICLLEGSTEAFFVTGGTRHLEADRQPLLAQIKDQ